MDSLLIDDIINYACERHKLRLLRTWVRLPPAPPLYDEEKDTMRITMRQLRRIIRESLSNDPMNAQLGGKIGNRSGGTIDQQVRELINAHYSLDQGWDQEEISDANDTVHRLESEMSPEDYKKATKIAELCVYYQEYATQQNVHQVVEEIEAACAQLGMTAEDVI